MAEDFCWLISVDRDVVRNMISITYGWQDIFHTTLIRRMQVCEGDPVQTLWSGKNTPFETLVNDELVCVKWSKVPDEGPSVFGRARVSQWCLGLLVAILQSSGSIWAGKYVYVGPDVATSAHIL